MRYIALSILFPVAAGVYLLVRKEPKNRKVLLAMTGVFLLLSAFWAALAICLGGKGMYTLFNLTDRLPILFKIDEVSILFSVLAAVIFLCAGSFSFVYMKHEQKEKRFYGYYLIVMGVFTALCFAGNLITFYLFFELLTLSSFPLVLHNGKKESVMAALKYLFYSLLNITGNLGDVMKESAAIALQWVKAHADELGIASDFFESNDIHLHVPEGATPKDGPSAGITMVTALVSMLTGRKVRERIAMTGETTLRGKVLPVGGLKEKILAAKRAGITDIILSEENRKDISEIKEEYIKGLKFHYVRTLDDVLKEALL